MKVFSSTCIAELDRFTEEHTPISSIDLMEQASQACSDWLLNNFPKQNSFVFFVGPGNNGGDALAMARQLKSVRLHCSIHVYLTVPADRLSTLAKINFDRLADYPRIEVTVVHEDLSNVTVSVTDLLIDGLFGAGLSRPLSGIFAQVVEWINVQPNRVVAIDFPSGLRGEMNTDLSKAVVLRADFTLTFQFPKLSFFFPECHVFIGESVVLPIGLHPQILASSPSQWNFFTQMDAAHLLLRRNKFDHKGTFGHALLIAGSYGKMGAAVLASRATLRSGVGLLTTHVPHHCYSIIQNSVPEAMVSIDQSDVLFTEAPDLNPYRIIGIGPGLGTKTNTARGFDDLLKRTTVPLVVDADGLNILAEHPAWMARLPEGSILTPHVGEFRRLVRDIAIDTGYERMKAAVGLARRFSGVVILKGAHTMIACASGQVYFNESGNVGMATAGSGDTLTGIILGLYSSGYTGVEAACLGVYLHGLSGDLYVENYAEESLIASDLIRFLPHAFHVLKEARASEIE